MPAKKKATTSKKFTTTKMTYSMPVEVKEWIDRASSTIQHQKGVIDRLKKEVADLKQYKAWATHRILGTSKE